MMTLDPASNNGTRMRTLYTVRFAKGNQWTLSWDNNMIFFQTLDFAVNAAKSLAKTSHGAGIWYDREDIIQGKVDYYKADYYCFLQSYDNGLGCPVKPCWSLKRRYKTVEELTTHIEKRHQEIIDD